MKILVRRLTWRLFYCLISLLVATNIARAAGPATTTISDVVYRADGTPATGSVIITWTDFTTADGDAVAAGSLSLIIGPAGALTVALVPDAGATPAGTYYKVVYQLDDGTTSTEYWSVPAASPTTIAAIRTLVVPATVAAQFVSEGLLDSALALKANDNSVVHTVGNESVAGVKSFTASPSVPTPVNPNDAVNKSYVDSFAPGGGAGGGAGTCPAGQYVYALSAGAPLCRSVGAERFADQFASIQAAITDAGTTGEVVIPASYTSGDTYTNPHNLDIVDYRGTPDRYKGFVNVITDCGAVGNGVADDGPAINACIARNPGRTIFFPKMSASNSGGGTATNCDYFSSQTIALSGNSMALVGEMPGRVWTGKVCIAFPAGIDGIVILATCYGCSVSNLELHGPASQCFSPIGDMSTYRTDLGGNGFSLYGGEPTLQNDIAECFGQNGAVIDGGSESWVGGTGQPDLWTIRDSQFDANLGWGLLIFGGDSNGGHSEGLDLRNNKLGGMYDHSILGNTHNMAVAHANGTNTTPPGTPGGNGRKCSTIVRSSNVVTCTTFTDVAGFAVGSTIAVTGVTGAATTFNGLFTLTAVNAAGPSVSWSQSGVNESIGTGFTGLAGGIGKYFSIASISGASDTAAVATSGAHGFIANQFVVVSGTGTNMDGEYLVASVPDSTHFTYTVIGATGSASTGATYAGGSWDIYGLQGSAGASRVTADAAITSGSSTLFSRSAQFDTHNLGDAITVKGADASGANLVTTIASVTNPTTVQLAASASTTVTNAKIQWVGGFVPAGYKCDTSSEFDYPYWEGTNASNEMTASCDVIQTNANPSISADLSFGTPTTLTGSTFYADTGMDMHFPNGGSLHLFSGNSTPQPFTIAEYNNATGIPMNCLINDWAPPSAYVEFLVPNCDLNKGLVTWDRAQSATWTAPAVNGHMVFGNVNYGNDYAFLGSNACSGCAVQTANFTGNVFKISQNGDLLTYGNNAGANWITLHPPATTFSPWEWDWPTSAGAAGQCLLSQGGVGAAMIWGACGGAGGVTSVALSMPASTFSVSGSPVTTSGTLTAGFASQSQGTALLGPSAYGAAAAVPTWRALAPQDMPPSFFNCQFEFENICTSPVDSNGNPNFLSAGSGAAVNVSGGTTALAYFVEGTYQVINANLSVTAATPAVETEYFIFAKKDTSNANPVSADLVATSCAPAVAPAKPSACATVSSSNKQYWYDLTVKQMKSSSDGSTFAHDAAILLGVAAVSSTPAVDAVAPMPYDLTPQRAYKEFGSGANGALAKTSGTTTQDGAFQYTGCMLSAATLQPSAQNGNTVNTPGLLVSCQTPILLVKNSAINAVGLGRAGSAQAAGTATQPFVGGFGGAGGGSGGASATNAGAAGGNHQLWSGEGTSGGGSSGAIGGSGGAGNSVQQGWVNGGSLPAFNSISQCANGAGTGGANGGGDGTAAHDGAGGNGGGVVCAAAPGINLTSGSTWNCNGTSTSKSARSNSSSPTCRPKTWPTPLTDSCSPTMSPCGTATTLRSRRPPRCSTTAPSGKSPPVETSLRAAPRRKSLTCSRPPSPTWSRTQASTCDRRPSTPILCCSIFSIRS